MSAPKFPATFIGHAPNGPTPCCVPHARALERIMRKVGVRVNFTKAPDDAECTNCVLEAAANAKKAGSQ